MNPASLQERFPAWDISQTPKGIWVARRKKHIVLTMSRIDQGLRDNFIEENVETLIAELERQTEIDERLADPKTK